jgi:hypothetical protein
MSPTNIPHSLRRPAAMPTLQAQPQQYFQDDPECDDFQDAIQDETLLHVEEKMNHEEEMYHDFQDAVQEESSIPSDLLTYWMYHDVLAHNAMHVNELSNIVDSQNIEEQEPIFFDSISSPTEKKPTLLDKGSVPIYIEKLLPVDKGSVSLFDPSKKNESHLDTSIDPRDSDSGYSQLNLWSYKRPTVTRSSIFIPRQDKENYNNIWYPCNQFPPAKDSKVELPTREKKTEPVQDPVPRVKGIRGTPPKVWYTKKKRV